MGVPIKSNNTQQGCNPISSNCVIWQGPDIPCIKMCTGDSVSDTIAKLATELCEITSELDISLLDLSCFNPLYPTPQSFKDVMQIILDKICALENGTVDDGKTNTSGCPQDCEVQIAGCLQYQDYLGNNVTTLPLKDYVILIGNKICTILSDITNLQNQIDNLDVRVEALENAPSGSGSLFNVTSDCISSGSIPLDQYIPLLDQAFCELQTFVGPVTTFNTMTQNICVTGFDSAYSPDAPGPVLGAYPSWIGTPTTISQYMQNMWVTICDLRTALNACCNGAEPAPSIPCPDFTTQITWSYSKPVIKFAWNYPDGWAITNFSGQLVCSGVPQNQVSINFTITGNTSAITGQAPVVGDGITPNYLLTTTGTCVEATSLSFTNPVFTLTNLQDQSVTCTFRPSTINIPGALACPTIVLDTLNGNTASNSNIQVTGYPGQNTVVVSITPTSWPPSSNTGTNAYVTLEVRDPSGTLLSGSPFGTTPTLGNIQTYNTYTLQTYPDSVTVTVLNIGAGSSTETTPCNTQYIVPLEQAPTAP
ncbi:MAG: hypothetical protein EBU90_14890 [Proteobacteria bacterium]|nr:hypothetical protein [Pseudomonadota bacterium]NBP14448.1 hypothetical protein [bacterium]